MSSTIKESIVHLSLETVCAPDPERIFGVRCSVENQSICLYVAKLHSKVHLAKCYIWHKDPVFMLQFCSFARKLNDYCRLKEKSKWENVWHLASGTQTSSLRPLKPTVFIVIIYCDTQFKRCKIKSPIQTETNL